MRVNKEISFIALRLLNSPTLTLYMIIGIDCSNASSEKRTGVEAVSYQLVSHLNKIDKANQYRLYTPFKLSSDLVASPNFKEVLIPFVKFWNKVRLPLELLKNEPDILLSPGYMIPSFAPKKTAVIIHDLAYKYFPDAYSRKEIFLQELAAKRAVRKARMIIFPSESAKNDFHKFHRLSIKRTTVVPLGFDVRRFNKISEPRDILSIKSPYFLFVGRLETRKNVAKLVQAYEIFQRETKSNVKLVLAGKPGYGYATIEETIAKLPKETQGMIILPGYIKDADLPHLYARAECFVFPSLYEGFGLPILESFASGIPVISSNISSIPEVAENAAILVNPSSEQEIAQAMITITSDTTVKNQLIKLGNERISHFSWENFAKEVLSILESL